MRLGHVRYMGRRFRTTALMYLERAIPLPPTPRRWLQAPVHIRITAAAGVLFSWGYRCGDCGPDRLLGNGN